MPGSISRSKTGATESRSARRATMRPRPGWRRPPPEVPRHPSIRKTAPVTAYAPPSTRPPTTKSRTARVARSASSSARAVRLRRPGVLERVVKEPTELVDDPFERPVRALGAGEDDGALDRGYRDRAE